MNKALTLFLILVLSPFLAFADATFDALEAKAEKGGAEAQLNVAGCYAQGIGVIKDKTKAVECLQIAADQENAKAQAALGLHCLLNSSIPNNLFKAVDLFQNPRLKE